MRLYVILNATEAVYQWLLFLRGKNGGIVRNRGVSPNRRYPRQERRKFRFFIFFLFTHLPLKICPYLPIRAEQKSTLTQQEAKSR